MENEMITASSGTAAMLNSSEIDTQITTAHKYPRSIKGFRDETMQLVTLSESVAGECIYSLPRAGKTIEGPSARFAEILISSWGNCRAGARVISEDDGFITAQGVFHDLEKNSAITYEVRRRITDKNGRKFKPDMVAVTANAACSIALRNAALKGVPKAFWSDMYDAARQTVMGDIQTLSNRRAKMLEALLRYGVTEDVVLKFLEVQGIEDITLHHMTQLRGLGTSLKEGETTLERILAELNGEKKAEKLSDLLPPKKTVDTSTGEVTPYDIAAPDPKTLISLAEVAATTGDLDAVLEAAQALDKRTSEYQRVVDLVAIRREELR